MLKLGNGGEFLEAFSKIIDLIRSIHPFVAALYHIQVSLPELSG